MRSTPLVGALAFCAALLTPLVAAHSDNNRIVLNSSPWTLAAVFQRAGGRRLFRGTVFRPAVPFNGDRLPANEPSGKAATAPDYEVWLAGNGVTLGLWFSTQRQRYGEITDTGQLLSGLEDDGRLQRLVDRAHRRKPPALEAPVDARATISSVPPPADLSDLCRLSDVIVAGRVVDILRAGHNPLNSAGSAQHTVFLFAIEDQLKSSTGERPGILKVYQEGGSLPWIELDGKVVGSGFAIRENPLLRLGERYCLFLRKLSDPSNYLRKLGYVPETRNGVSGKVGELDELLFADFRRGRLLLKGGKTQMQPDTIPEDAHWRFRTGEQILDVDEKVALKLIEDTVKAQTRQ